MTLTDALPTALAALTAAGDPIHIDFETTGLDAHDPDQRPVLVGLANAAGVWAFDLREWDAAAWEQLGAALARVGWGAFNVPFDGAWLMRQLPSAGLLDGRVQDSLLLFRLLATEGFLGQSWSLGVAMTTVLGWDDGGQKAWLTDALSRHKLAKATMWQLQDLEPTAFATYCGQDADASYRLWSALWPQAAEHPSLVRYVQDEWRTMLRLLIEQQLRGLVVDRPALAAYAERLDADIQAAEAALRAHPRLAPHLAEWETREAEALYAPQVVVKRTRARRADAPSAETGWLFQPSTAKTLAKWEAAVGGYWYKETTREVPRNADKPAPRFNFESDPSVRWLLYTRVYRSEPTPGGRPDRPHVRVWLDTTDYVDVPCTASGLPPVGKEVLPALGEIGQLLTAYNQLSKRLGYVTAYLDASAADARLHPKFKAPGTVTGRLSGGGEG